MQIVIEKIKILTGRGTDIIWFYVKDKPSASWPYNEELKFETTAASGCGESYCNEHFYGIPLEIVDVS